MAVLGASVLGVLVLDRAVSVLVLGVSVSGASTLGVLVLDRAMRPSVRAGDALAWRERGGRAGWNFLTALPFARSAT